MVSGSFKNLAGLIATIDAANGTLTLKDLATKKTVTVTITANSNVRTLPLQAATMLAARRRVAPLPARVQRLRREQARQTRREDDRAAGLDGLLEETSLKW